MPDGNASLRSGRKISHRLIEKRLFYECLRSPALLKSLASEPLTPVRSTSGNLSDQVRLPAAHSPAVTAEAALPLAAVMVSGRAHKPSALLATSVSLLTVMVMFAAGEMPPDGLAACCCFAATEMIAIMPMQIETTMYSRNPWRPKGDENM